MAPSLTNFKALSFDCYGTLIDWETGIFSKLQPLRDQLPQEHEWHDKDTLITRFSSLQTKFEAEQPTTTYNNILSQCFKFLANEVSLKYSEQDVVSFGNSVGEWPAFPDTVAGLQHLNKHCHLVILSNVDNANLRRTLEGPLSGVRFAGTLTAENIKSYKPNHANFEALFEFVEGDLKLKRSDLLHVAKSLPVDHVPAKQLGVTSAWIARGSGGVSAMGGKLNELRDQVSFTWRFGSIGEMAEAVDKAFA